jgi:hypothetical protein
MYLISDAFSFVGQLVGHGHRSSHNGYYHNPLDVNRDGRVDFQDGLIIGRAQQQYSQYPYQNYQNYPYQNQYSQNPYQYSYYPYQNQYYRY